MLFKKYDIVVLLYGDIEYDSRVKRISTSLSKTNSVLVVSVNKDKYSDYNFISENVSHKRINLLTRFFPKNGKYGYLKLIEASFLFVLYSLFSKKIYCNDIETLFSGYVLSFFKKNIIYDTHELTPFRGNPSKRKSRYISFIESILIRKVSVLFTVTDRITKWYKKRYNIKKVFTILNSPNLELFVPEKKNNKFVWVGIFGNNRGIASILENYETLEVNKIVIDFYGWGPLEDDIKNISNLSSSINYCGVLQQSDLFEILSSYKAGLFTYESTSKNYDYAYPNKFYEYVFSGIPIVSTPLLQAKSLISTFKIGYIVDDFSIESLIDAMVNIEKYYNFGDFRNNQQNYYDSVNWSKQEFILLKEILKC